MKKCWKWILALVAVGTAVGLLVAYFYKKNKVEDELDEMDEEDFDLDVDLQPVADREYVSLKKSTPEVEETEEEAAEEVEEDTAEPEEAE